jgi:tetratricopeptide (TPR) repeat protein
VLPGGPKHPSEDRGPKYADLAAADILLRAGRYAAALDVLKAAPVAPGAGAAVAYREGLCLEALGRTGEADAAYRRAEEETGAVATRTPARLGRARCAAVAGDRDAARRTLDAVVLQSGHPDCRGRHVLEECLYVRAGLEAATLAPAPPPAAFALDAPARVPLAGGWAEYLDWLPVTPLPAAPPVPGTPAGRIEVRREGDDTRVTARATDRPPAQFLRDLAAAAGLTARIPDAAGLDAGPVSVEVEDAPLPEVLTALAGRAGWRIDGGVLAVSAAGPPAPVGALRLALTAAPAHPTALAARLALANLDFAAGRWREAGPEYQRILDAHRTSGVTVPAAYNLGLVELRGGRPAAARKCFLDVADRDPVGGPGSAGGGSAARTWIRAPRSPPAGRSGTPSAGRPTWPRRLPSGCPCATSWKVTRTRPGQHWEQIGTARPARRRRGTT